VEVKRDPLLIGRRADDAHRSRPSGRLLFRLLPRGLDTGAGRRRARASGKAYFGFTDEELIEIDRSCAATPSSALAPCRGRAEADQGLVLEVAFEGLQRFDRHKSGIAMRFPRINRLRWDKPPGEADRLETLEAMLSSPWQPNREMC